MTNTENNKKCDGTTPPQFFGPDGRPLSQDEFLAERQAHYLAEAEWVEMLRQQRIRELMALALQCNCPWPAWEEWPVWSAGSLIRAVLTGRYFRMSELRKQILDFQDEIASLLDTIEPF